MIYQGAEQRAAYMAQLRDIERASNLAMTKLAKAILGTLPPGRYEDVTVQKDVVYIPDMALAIKDPGFKERYFTERERKYCGRSVERYASAFGIKEAVMKTLDAWPDWLTEIEALHRPSGAPYVELSGSALRMRQNLGIEHLQASVSHSGNFATAYCTGFWAKRYYHS